MLVLGIHYITIEVIGAIARGEEVNRQELFEKMKLACEQKYQAYLLCREISERSADPEILCIFDKIAREEMAHREEIMKRYSALASSTN